MSKTELNDRVLYYDGDTEVSPDRVLDFIDLGLTQFYVTEITPEIEQFNRYASNPVKLKPGQDPLKFDWNIPEEYQNLDVVNYVYDRLSEHREQLYDAQFVTRAKRVEEELILYESLDLLAVLRAIIYVINTLQEKNIVWGVGRGSSVSSYVLYLIGVHDVDSVKYNLDISDFLRTGE